MGILKDAGDSLLKYGEIIVNKTEEYTRIAKLTFDIKKLEGEEEKVKIEIGSLIIEKIGKGVKTLNLNDEEIKSLYDKIKKINDNIKSIRKKIEKHKKAGSTKPESENTEGKK